MEADFTLIDLLLLTWKEKKIVVFVGTTYEQLLLDWMHNFIQTHLRVQKIQNQ